MPVFWLDDHSLEFPDPMFSTPDGLTAIGGDLSVERLLTAYQKGFFPWFNPEDPILWWCPDPRCVLYPDKIKISKSMRSYINQDKFEVTFDQAFEEVMRSCQVEPRKGQVVGSWITEDMILAYKELHLKGYVHSVEVWEAGNLVGGLYGVTMGRIFFGESMFTKVSNASKFGFIKLVEKLRQLDYALIDCQQETAHLVSLGAELIPRKNFLAILEDQIEVYHQIGHWPKS